MKTFFLIAIIGCVFAAEVKEKEESTTAAQTKDKRDTQGDLSLQQYVFAVADSQEKIAPVEEPQEEDDKNLVPASGRSATLEQYRPGQVFSLNPQELIELQPERKAPVSQNQPLQSLYSNPQPEHKQNLQKFYFTDAHYGPQQVTLQPSRTVIARPSSLSSGGEASVGAALSVSDSGHTPADSGFDESLFALLGQNPAKAEDRQVQALQVTTQNIAQQYQQIDRYLTPNKFVKKATKIRPKTQGNLAAAGAAPQQYLIETTNVGQQQLQQHQQQQQQQQLQQQQQHLQQQQYQYQQQPKQPLKVQQIQYKYVSQTPQPQAFRYVPIQPAQQVPAIPQVYYQQPESQSQGQGLKVVQAPKLHQPRAQQYIYKYVPQYQPEVAPKQYEVAQKQYEVAPKQYRLIDLRPQSQKVEQQRVPASSVDRPVSFVKKVNDYDKMRAIKALEQPNQEGLNYYHRLPQFVGDLYLRHPYRPTNVRYDIPQYLLSEQYNEQPKAQQVAYVKNNYAQKSTPQPPPARIEETVKPTQSPQEDHSSRVQNANKPGLSMDERRAHLPPPKNNRAYTPEEFTALVAAGYAVTPVPVGSVEQPQAQSRASFEAIPSTLNQRRVNLSRRQYQYLPRISDEAP